MIICLMYICHHDVCNDDNNILYMVTVPNKIPVLIINVEN